MGRECTAKIFSENILGFLFSQDFHTLTGNVQERKCSFILHYIKFSIDNNKGKKTMMLMWANIFIQTVYKNSNLEIMCPRKWLLINWIYSKHSQQQWPLMSERAKKHCRRMFDIWMRFSSCFAILADKNGNNLFAAISKPEMKFKCEIIRKKAKSPN